MPYGSLTYLSLLDEQLFELMRGLDKDCDSTIDIQEFASRFEPVFTRLNLKQDVSRDSRDGVCGPTYLSPLLGRFSIVGFCCPQQKRGGFTSEEACRMARRSL